MAESKADTKNETLVPTETKEDKRQSLRWKWARDLRQVLCHHCKQAVPKTLLCSGCRHVRYCSVECQRSDRPVHKHWCRADCREPPQRGVLARRFGTPVYPASCSVLPKGVYFEEWCGQGFYGLVGDVQCYIGVPVDHPWYEKTTIEELQDYCGPTYWDRELPAVYRGLVAAPSTGIWWTGWDYMHPWNSPTWPGSAAQARDGWPYEERTLDRSRTDLEHVMKLALQRQKQKKS